jgi:predicted lipoprotein with Yx(FWY)xxD motif
MKKLISLVFIFSLFLSISLVYGGELGVQIKEKEGIGKFLTDSEGKTLYWFKKDSPGKSACSGPCVERWPIFFSEKISVSSGLKKEDFSTITREDGKKQTTFRGYPLYYWFNDKQAGDTSGHGVNNVWFVINPDNFPPKQ